MNGDYSGMVVNEASITLNGKETAKALNDQGSDPSFFMLDEEGNDIE